MTENKELHSCKSCGARAEYEKRQLETIIRWGIGCEDKNCINHEPTIYYNNCNEAELVWNIKQKN